jgi:hypothetical protein
LATDGLALTCDGGAAHRLLLDRDGWLVVDHDTDAEAVLGAVGGTPPVCLRVAAAIDAAGSDALWATLDRRRSPSAAGAGGGGGGGGGGGSLAVADPEAEALGHVASPDLAVLLARALHAEFADASVAVRDSVARLGLSLLAPRFAVTPAITLKFQVTRELPMWEPGDGAWTDRELVLLSRCMRTSAGEARPHLSVLPADPTARRAVAKYLVHLLDEHRLLSRVDLREALASTSHNVRAATALLVSERMLEPFDGGYRVVTVKARSSKPSKPRRRTAT